MAKAKDKAYHADGSMTAAEYKRRFLNKAARLRAVEAVSVRSNVGAMTGIHKATAKDKQKLRNFRMRTEPMPGDFYNTRNASATKAGDHMVPLKKGRTSSHLVTSF